MSKIYDGDGVNMTVFNLLSASGKEDNVVRRFFKGKDLFFKFINEEGFTRGSLLDVILNLGEASFLIEFGGKSKSWAARHEIAAIKFVNVEDGINFISEFGSGEDLHPNVLPLTKVTAEMPPVQPPARDETHPETSVDIDKLVDELGLKTSLAREALRVVLHNVCVLDRKQQDYGSQNLLNFGVLGVVVRANDKMSRLVNLTATNRKTKPNNESVADTFLDLSNYGLIGYLMQMGIWPTK